MVRILKVKRKYFNYLLNLRSRNDHPIEENDRIKLDVSGETVKLIISEAAATDAGTYELVAENGLGSIESTARLTVHCM